VEISSHPHCVFEPMAIIMRICIAIALILACKAAEEEALVLLQTSGGLVEDVKDDDVFDRADPTDHDNDHHDDDKGDVDENGQKLDQALAGALIERGRGDDDQAEATLLLQAVEADIAGAEVLKDLKDDGVSDSQINAVAVYCANHFHDGNDETVITAPGIAMTLEKEGFDIGQSADIMDRLDILAEIAHEQLASATTLVQKSVSMDQALLGKCNSGCRAAQARAQASKNAAARRAAFNAAKANRGAAMAARARAAAARTAARARAMARMKEMRAKAMQEHAEQQAAELLRRDASLETFKAYCLENPTVGARCDDVLGTERRRRSSSAGSHAPGGSR